MVDVRALAHEEEDAFPAVLADAGEVHHFPADRGDVELEVARVKDDADGRADRNHAGVRDRVIRADEFGLEAAELDGVAGLYGHELAGAEELVLHQLRFEDAEGEAGGVHGNVDELEQVRDAADVVLVPVRDEDAADLRGVLFEIGIIGNDEVHAEHVFVGEGQAAVDDDHVVFVFQHGEVLSDLVQPAEHHDAQLAGLFFRFCHSVPFISGAPDPSLSSPEVSGLCLFRCQSAWNSFLLFFFR